MTNEEALRCLFTVAHEACSGPIVTLRGTILEDEDNFEYVERMYEQVRQALARGMSILSEPEWMSEPARRKVIACVDEIMHAIARYGDDVGGVGRVREVIASIPTQPVLYDPISNVSVEVATDVLEHQLKTGSFVEAHTCTKGLGFRARLVDAGFDPSSKTVVLRFHDPDREGHVAGTDIRVNRTDEKINPVFVTNYPVLDDEVAAALDWLKADCHQEASAMDRIATLTRHFGARRR